MTAASTTSTTALGWIEPIDFGVSTIQRPTDMQVAPAVRDFKPPETWPLMQVDPTPLTEATVKAVADKLGLVNPTMKMGTGGWGATLSDSSWELMFPRPDDATPFRLESMDWVKGTYDKGVAYGASPPSLPTSQEAKAIADALLQNTGLLEGLRFIKVGWKTMTNSVITTLGVSYRQIVDGREVVGPGSGVSVTIGEGGRVLALEHLMEHWKPAGQVALRPVYDALVDLAAARGSYPSDPSPRIVVEKVELAFYAEPIPLGKTLAKPVYVFTATDPDKPDAPPQTYIEAATYDSPLPGTRLSPETKQQLDSLDAVGVVRTYCETVDFDVVYYLSAPREQQMMMAPNYVRERRHPGDIANLVIRRGPLSIYTDPGEYSREEWPIQVQFVVEFDELIPRGSGSVNVGPQIRFIYIGRQSPSSPWRVLGQGTGP